MKHEASLLKSYGFINLYVQQYKVEQPVASVLLIHGLGEHADRYRILIDELLAHNIAVFTMDIRGFGRSEGLKGDITSYRAVINDIRLLENLAIAYSPNTPIILYGHSMGGNLALNYALRIHTDIKAVIASAPYLALTKPKPLWIIKLARLLNRFVPKLRVNNGLNPADISTNVAVQESYLKDPMVYRKISIRTFLALEAAAAYNLQNASLLQIPAYIYHGTADAITNPKASESFARNNPDFVTYTAIPGAYHELHHDLQAPNFKQELIDLILRCAK